MVEFLISWAEQLIIALIIIILIEMILPNSSYRKYIKIVLGIFVLYAIFNPILKNKLDKIDFGKVLSYSNENEIIENEVTIKYEDQIAKVYSEKLKSAILENLHSKGYDSEDIELNIEYKDEEIIVNNLSMKIRKYNNKEIEIKIGNSNNKIDTEEINNLKAEISNTYNIEISKIIIESENNYD